MTADPAIAAFFDLDHTVLNASSSTLWAQYLYREGRMSRVQMAAMAWYTLRYKLAIIDMDSIMRLMASTMRGQSEAELIAECERWFEEMVASHIAPVARERVHQHQAQGHTVALLTASTAYVAAPTAHSLGAGVSYISTRLEVENGLFTGRCIEPICFGPGKVYWAREFCTRRGLELAESYFYTDSYTDLAMLEAVGHPVAVNPDARLRRHASRQGWPIEQFF